PSGHPFGQGRRSAEGRRDRRDLDQRRLSGLPVPAAGRKRVRHPQPPANGGSTSTVSPALSAADRSVAATELTRKLDRESTVAACGSASSARAETSSSTDPARMCDSRAPKASRAAAKNRTVIVGIYPPMALMGRWGCWKSSVPMPLPASCLQFAPFPHFAIEVSVLPSRIAL